MDAHERRALPDGWEWKRLGDVATIGAGGTPSRGKQEYWEDGTIAWAKISDISDKYISETSEKITNKGLENSSAKVFPKGTILISIFATLGDVGILNIDSACNQALAGIKLNNSNVNRDYLYYYLKTLKSHFESIGRGVAQNNINLTILKGTKILLPPLPTQRRIVSLLEKAEETKRLRAQADELTDRLLQSVFLEMFGDPVRNPKGWEVVKAKEIFKMRLGKMLSAKNYTGKNLRPYLRNVNVQWEYINVSDIKEMDFDEDDFEKYKLCKGDILVCEGGEVGRSAIYNGEIQDCCYQNALHRLRIIKPVIESEFFVQFMKIAATQGLIQKTSSQVTIAHFTQEDFKEFNILLPPLPLQQKFARIVEKGESMRQSQNQSKQQVEDLFSALMQKAFRGELDKSIYL